jgi:hypothetical protein
MRNWVITCDNHEPCLRESDVIFHIEKIYYHDRKREHLILYRRPSGICGLDVTTEAYPYIAGFTNINSALFNRGWREKIGLGYDALQMPDTGER